MATEVARNGHEDLESFAFFLRYPPVTGRRRRPKGDATIRTYLWTAGKFVAFLDGREPTTEAATDFVLSMEDADLAPRSIALHVYALRAYFTYLGKDLGIGAPAFVKKIPARLNDDQWATLLAHAEQPLWNDNLPTAAKTRALFHRAALMVYGGAGLRLTEGIELRREIVDPRGYLRIIAKGGKERIVPVEDAVIISIQEWIATHDSPWVFPGKIAETHLHPSTMHGVIRDLMIGSGVPPEKIHRAVHMLRHTMGAQLRKYGADIRDIQQLFGHADISTTMIYTEMVEEDLRKKLPKRFVQFRQGRLA